VLTYIIGNRLVLLQTATITVGAVGQTVTWSAGTSYYARRVPLDVKTIAAYQDLATVVTDKFIFAGNVTVQIGKNRIVDGAKTYEPVSSAKHFDTPMWTEVVVRQI
jgi:hypothetical protein